MQSFSSLSKIGYIQTPDGIILPHENVSPNSGIHSGNFKLAEIVRLVI